MQSHIEDQLVTQLRPLHDRCQPLLVSHDDLVDLMVSVVQLFSISGQKLLPIQVDDVDGSRLVDWHREGGSAEIRVVMDSIEAADEQTGLLDAWRSVHPSVE